MSSDSDQVRDLWGAFVAGEPLSEGDQRFLLDALRGDPSTRDDLLHDAEYDGMIRALAGRGKEGDAVAQAFLQMLQAEGEASRFLKKVETRIDEVRQPRPQSTRRWARRGRGGRRDYLAPALVAAGLLFAIVLLFSLSPSSPSPAHPVRSEASRRERDEAAAEARRKKAEADRAEAEARLAGLREEEARAGEARRKALETQEEEVRKKAEQAFADALRKRKEEEERLARLREEERRAEEAKRALIPAPPSPGPEEKPRTGAAVARMERVEGDGYVVFRGEKKAVKTGQDLGAGQGIETGEGTSRVEIAFPDKTKLELGPATEVRDLQSDGGKRVHLVRGDLRAQVAKQAKGQEMIFATPHGEAKVLGTTLRILVHPDPKMGSRLEVEEGKVRLTNLAGKTVEVPSGYFAIAAAGVELELRPLPREIVLFAADLPKSDIHGLWQTVADDTAAFRMKLVLPRSPDPAQASIQQPAAGPLHYVDWTFEAPAGVAFRLWVRLKADAGFQNSFWVQFSDSVDPSGRPVHRIGTKDAFDINARLAPDVRGWLWERDHNAASAAYRRANPTVRFATSGKHRLRLQYREGGVALDQVVLSSEKFLDTAPGALTEDATILPRGR